MLDNERIGATRIDATQFVAGYTQTGIDEGTNRYTVIPTPVEFSEELDYAVLEVLGNPSQMYGKLNLVNLVPKDRTPFWVIGHPNGEGQRISREKCRASAPAVSKNKLLHTCDTLPGNSGSPVIDAGLQVVVALHHAGISNESVNAAILMSEILANSSVLAAYKAPVTVAKSADTVELKVCDALYSAASDAKACFAYEAYLKSCRGHALAPIAEGYIEKFCQVQKTTQIEPKPTQTCSQDAKQCGDEQICSLATKNGRWDTSSVNQFYVQEAKKRGLDCKVKAVTARRCSNAAPQNCTALALCNAANAGGSGTSIFKKEVQKRGLSCGSKPIVERVCSVQTAQVCTKEEICERLSAIRPRYSSHQAYAREAEKRGLTCGVVTTLACSFSTPDVCTEKEICIGATYERGGTLEWLGSVNWNVKEAKKRGLTCGVYEIIETNFRQAFVSLPKLKRQQLQYALKKLGHYSYGIDGLWGKGTSAAFDKFVNSNGLRVNTEAQVFSRLLSEVNVPSSFKPEPIRIAVNWNFDINCSGQKILGKASFNNRKLVSGKTQYSIFYVNDRGGRYQGRLEISGIKFQFRMKMLDKDLSGTGSGKFSSSYRRAEGTTSDNCSFVASPDGL
jgi:hypothetical protein